LEEIMLERGLKVAHFTICRWVHRYAPELDKRCRPHLKPTNDSYRGDETYIKVKGNWTYLYRAADSKGDPIEFMLSEHIDAKSAERFFEKALKSPHSADPRVINVDKNAAYPPAMAVLKENDLVEDACKLRQVKYLNNIVEQDHRFIKRR
jgi:transposase-like protein